MITIVLQVAALVALLVAQEVEEAAVTVTVPLQQQIAVAAAVAAVTVEMRGLETAARAEVE